MYVQKMRSPKQSSGIVVAGKQQNIWAYEEEATERERERELLSKEPLSIIFIILAFFHTGLCVWCGVVLCFVLFCFVLGGTKDWDRQQAAKERVTTKTHNM
jgi:hypothetical protein